MELTLPQAHHIELKQLRYAIAAADHGSFRKAADFVHLDQSTFGRQIRDLELALGIDLFARDTSGVRTTSVGDAFLKRARRLILDADTLFANTSRKSADHAAALNIGCMTPIARGPMQQALHAFIASHPAVRLAAHEEDRDVLFHRLERGTLDFVIATGTVHRDGCDRLGLWSARVIAALSENHPLAAHDRLEWAQLKDELFVLPRSDAGADLQDIVTGRLSEPGWRPRIEIQSVSQETILNGLAAANFVTLGYEEALSASYSEVALREIAEAGGPCRVRFSGYWRKRNSAALLEAFIEHMRVEAAEVERSQRQNPKR